MGSSITSYLHSINAQRMAQGNLLPQEKEALANHLTANQDQYAALFLEINYTEPSNSSDLADKFLTHRKEIYPTEQALFQEVMKTPTLAVLEAPQASSVSFTLFPRDVLVDIFSRLPPEGRLALHFVCKRVSAIAKDLLIEAMLLSWNRPLTLKDELGQVLFNAHYQSNNATLLELKMMYQSSMTERALF